MKAANRSKRKQANEIREPVGAYEAKTHFGQLLDEVAQGASITITRNGHPVAQLVPMPGAEDRERVREAIRGLLGLRKSAHLNGLTIRELIEEGRRF